MKEIVFFQCHAFLLIEYARETCARVTTQCNEKLFHQPIQKKRIEYIFWIILNKTWYFKVANIFRNSKHFHVIKSPIIVVIFVKTDAPNTSSANQYRIQPPLRARGQTAAPIHDLYRHHMVQAWSGGTTKEVMKVACVSTNRQSFIRLEEIPLLARRLLVSISICRIFSSVIIWNVAWA